MNIFHRRKNASVEAADRKAVADADYDAQTDLALPSSGSETSPEEGFVPFAGQLAPEPPNAGYDVLRDTGVDTG